MTSLDMSQGVRDTMYNFDERQTEAETYLDTQTQRQLSVEAYKGYFSNHKKLYVGSKLNVTNTSQQQQSSSISKWRQTVDKASGKTYYYNYVTKETSWKAPIGWETDGQEANNGRVAVQDKIPGAAKENKRGDGNQVSQSGLVKPMAPGSGSRTTIRDIQKAVDPRTGRWYYYDRATRETFWYDPRDTGKGMNNPTKTKRPSEVRTNEDYGSVGHGTNVASVVPAKQVKSSLQLLKRKMKSRTTTRSADIDMKTSTASVSLDRTSSEPETNMRARSQSDQRKISLQHHQQAMHTSSQFDHQSENVSQADPHRTISYSDDVLKTPPQSDRQRRLSQSGQLKTPSRLDQQNTLSQTGQSRTPSKCQRKSGCLCASCRTAGALVSPAGSTIQVSQPIPDPENDIALLAPCRHCGRNFNPNSLAVHEPVCNKVFHGQKQLKTPLPNVNKSQNKTASSKRSTSWRARSQQIREAMRSMKGDALNESRDSKPVSRRESNVARHSAESASEIIGDPQLDLTACPHCHRTFNQKAAERHIPVCNSIKAKPKLLRRRTGHGAYNRTPSPRTTTQSEPIDRKTRRPSTSSTLTRGRNSTRDSSNNPISHNSRPRTSGARQRVSVTQNGVQLSPCPNCGRQFSSKAFDRHMEYCSQKLEEKILDTAAKSRRRRVSSQHERYPPRGRERGLGSTVDLETSGTYQRRSRSSSAKPVVRSSLSSQYQLYNEFEEYGLDPSEYRFGGHYEAALRAVNQQHGVKSFTNDFGDVGHRGIRMTGSGTQGGTTFADDDYEYLRYGQEQYSRDDDSYSEDSY